MSNRHVNKPGEGHGSEATLVLQLMSMGSENAPAVATITHKAGWINMSHHDPLLDLQYLGIVQILPLTL